MRVTIDQTDLASAVAMTARAVSTRNAVPILSGILMRTEGGRLSLRATDLELAIQTETAAHVSQDGAVVLPSRMLSELVRRLPPGEISLRVDPRSYEATIEYHSGAEGKVSRLQLNGMAPEEFPLLPAVDGTALSMQPDVLKMLVRRTGFAVSADEPRLLYTGIQFSISGGLVTAQATDSIRLVWAVAGEREAQDVPAEVRCLIPSRALSELNRLLPVASNQPVIVTLTPTQAFFDFADIRLVTRLLEGQFPDFMSRLPQDYPTRVSVSSEHLLAAAERAQLIAFEGVLRLTIGGDQLAISATSPEVGQAYEEVGADVQGPGLEIGLNARYLIEGVRHAEASVVELAFTGPQAPVRIRPADRQDYTYIVMPVLVS